VVGELLQTFQARCSPRWLEEAFCGQRRENAAIMPPTEAKLRKTTLLLVAVPLADKSNFARRRDSKWQGLSQRNAVRMRWPETSGLDSARSTHILQTVGLRVSSADRKSVGRT
jgi:hypothetical protein